MMIPLYHHTVIIITMTVACFFYVSQRFMLTCASNTLLQFPFSTAGPEPTRFSNQHEAAKHYYAAKEMLQPPIPCRVSPGPCHTGIQGYLPFA